MEPQYLFFGAFFVVFGVVVISMVYQVFKHGGFRGALFGARVDRLIGEIQLQRRGIVSTKLKVHKLVAGEEGRSPDIGLEVIHTTFGLWQMSPVSLTKREAQQLADLLSRAAQNA
jgi:hypothetical protein